MNPTCTVCGQFLPAARYCQCGHQQITHGLTAKGVRSGCSVAEGPRGTPCGCRRYEETG